MDASFDRRPAGERAITRPTPATSTPAATRATNHRRRRTRRRERFEPCRKRASARSSANPMIGKLYGLVHSVLTLCKRPLPAHGTRPDDESGVPISVWTATECPERARPGAVAAGGHRSADPWTRTDEHPPPRAWSGSPHARLTDPRERRDKPEAKRG